MESDKKTKTKESPKIKGKKGMLKNMEKFPCFSQSNSPTKNKFQLQNQNLTEKITKDKNSLESKNRKKYMSPPENNNKNIIDKNDSPRNIKNFGSSSIENILSQKNQLKRSNNRYRHQVSNSIGKKLNEYLHKVERYDSSQKNIPNSMILKNYSKINSKNSFSPIYRHRSANNIYEEQKSSTFRYNNSGKYSPIFTYNTEENEEMNYNSRFSEELSMKKYNSNISIGNNNKTNQYNEINESMNKNMTNKKNNNNIICGNPFLYSSDDGMENSIKFEENKRNKKNKKRKRNDSDYNYNDFDNLFEAIRQEMETLIKMKVEIFVNKIDPYLSGKKNLYHIFLNSLLLKANEKNNKTKKILLKRIIKNKIKNNNKSLLFPLLYWNKISKSSKESVQNEGKDINIKNKKKENDINNKANLNKNKLRNETNKKLDDINKLKKIIISKIEKDNKDILRKTFNNWQNNANNYTENNKQLKESLLNIFINREKINNSIILFNLRKWNMITQKLVCISKIKMIQKNLRIYFDNNKKNKLKTFFKKIYINKLIYALNDIAKIYKLKSSLSNIARKKTNTKLNKIIKKNKIVKLLDKIIKNIDNKNNNSKMKYYLNKWNNRVIYIKNKDNKKLKVLLMRIVNRKDNLTNILKSYFYKWKKFYIILSIKESVLKIQKNWRKKKAIDNYNKKKDKKKKISNLIKIFEKAYKNKIYKLFMNKLKDKKKKSVLLKIESNFKNKRNTNLKYVIDTIKTFIKNKYISKILKISEKAKNEIIKKFFIFWKNKTKNGNKIYKHLNKFIERKENKNKKLILSILLKWLFHSKINNMEEKVIFIQKQYRNFKKNKNSINNWINLKNKLNINKKEKEIGNIIKNLKVYKSLNLIKNNLCKQSREIILKELIMNYKIYLFKKIMNKILTELSENNSYNLLKKYYIIWRDNINKEIEREDKLNDLLYVIEKRMNINCANYLSYVSLLKNIFDGVLNIRKYDCFYILKEFSERNKNINNLSNSLSLAYNDLKIKKYKFSFSKILKYFVYLKLLKLFEIIEQNKGKNLKVYKSLLMSYLKTKLDSENSILPKNTEKKRNSQPSKTLFKPKPKVDTKKQLNKSKNKSLATIKINLTKNDKKKEKIKSNDKIKRTNTVKGMLNKKNIIQNKKNEEKEKEKDIKNDNIIIVKNEEDSESDNENNENKDNRNDLLNIIEDIFAINKKELLLEFKERALKLKNKKEKEEEKKVYTKKLHNTLKKFAIKKILLPTDEIAKARKLLKLIKLTSINIHISKDRWIRQLLRKWRFIAFSKNLSKKKLELMYKNLHLGYLEIINALFNNQGMLKEFENFGDDMGMFKNSDYYMNREKELYQKVKKKYNHKSIEYDKENLMNIESAKFNNFFKFKSNVGEDSDFFIMDSDKEILNKQKEKVSNNYDLDK